MRNFSDELRAHLQQDATTTCTCWIVKQANGRAQGFTDHDEALVVEGIECAASTGFQPTEAVSDLGLSVDNQDIEGVLCDAAISAADLRAGDYDGANVEIWLVNWAQPEQRHHMRTAILGEVSEKDDAFAAELRGLTSLLDQKQGRNYSRHCDALLGDRRCGVNLATSGLTAQGTVGTVKTPSILQVDGLSGFADGWFSHGKLRWLTGANAGRTSQIVRHSLGSASVELWKPMPALPAPGDVFEITAGCDKRYSTCKAKFANGLNFQGCPHMPGSDFALGYASGEAIHDGSPLIV